MKRGVALACCVVVIGFAAGCSDSSGRESGQPVAVDGGEKMISVSQRYFGPVPDFKGPYAEDFKWIYVRTGTDLQRKILDDEKITEQELEELKSRVADCVPLHGREVGWERNGAYSYGFAEGLPYPDAEEVERILGEEEQEDLCQVRSTADIISLHWETQSNPNKEDAGVLIAACLVKAGLRPEGYTVNDYAGDSDRIGEQMGEDPDFREKFRECNDNPLGLVR